MTPRLAAKLQPLGLDFLFEWEGRVYILVDSEEIRRLDRSGIPTHRVPKFPALRPVRLFSRGA